MDNIFTTQLLQEAMANVDVSLVVALMAIGFIVKHFSLFEKIQNDIIPPVLLAFSILVLTITDGFTVPTIIAAIVNAAVAIGLHQQGKNLFTVTVIPSITKLFNNFFTNDGIEMEDAEEETFVDELEE